MPASSDDPQNARAASLAQDIRGLAGKLKRRLREQSDAGDLTPSQTAVLLRLEKHGPATTSSLARAEGMRPQSMGTVIDALQNAGLVRGAPDPRDGRQTILSITDECRRWIREGRAARQDWLFRTIQARLSAEEQDALTAAVKLLQRIVDD
jgi:DNA-binding MarR family transcriptional regulator